MRISVSITPLRGIQSSCLPAGGEEVTVSHEPTEDTVKSLRRQLAVETAAKDKIIEVLVCILFFVKFAFEHFRQKMLKSSL